jgi:DNA-directed RNA polymerase alpha subunit
MPNWITINNIAGDTGEALINLDSGMVVQRIHEQLDEHHTRIWSLHSGDRYLMGDAKAFDRIQESTQRNTTVDYYSAINDILWTNRVSNCFHAHGIEYISDLLNKTEADLLKMRFFGTGCLAEVIRNLANHNLTLSE